MRTEVVMPQMGESVTEGTVTQWLKELGDYVERDEPLFEITTDKVDAEVPSPQAGVLVERKVEVGQTVEINSVVAILDSEAKGADAAPKEEPSVGPSRAELRRTRSTPLVRRIAAEHGIEDLSSIGGSGLSGRVTKADILSFIEGDDHRRMDVETKSRAVNGRDRPRAEPAYVDSVTMQVRDRKEALGPQRMAIAEHMVRSRATSAHAHTIHEIDFSAVVRARKQLKGEFGERGVKLTYTAFMVQAIARALKAYPVVNASVDGSNLIYRGEINIGVAVALENSLIVPVVRNAEELSLQGVARAITDLADRARAKRLNPHEVQGGTFTLSNHGIFGPEFGVPIINQPQTAIISTGAIKKRVVVDQDTDAIMVRPTAMFCMSFDHRSVDGATADKFLAHIRQTLQNWSA